jgi:Carboxypeptidase regulatory-like domain
MSRKSAWPLVIITFAAVCSAQVEQGTITGSVTDQSDALVAGAQVTVRNVRTGVKAVRRTDTEGHYSAPYLPPGEYEVTVENSGFKRASVAGVNLTVGLTATINVRLEVGTVQSEVRVEASAVQLEQQRCSPRSTTRNLGSPNGSVTAPDFGRITSAGGTRTVQLGLRLSY